MRVVLGFFFFTLSRLTRKLRSNLFTNNIFFLCKKYNLLHVELNAMKYFCYYCKHFKHRWEDIYKLMTSYQNTKSCIQSGVTAFICNPVVHIMKKQF